MTVYSLSPRKTIALIGVFMLLSPAYLAAQERPVPPAAEIVAEMVRTETAAYKSREHFLYLRKERSARTKGHLWQEVVVETPDGRMHRLIAQDGKPLSAEEKKAEDDRITSLVNHPDQFRREEQARKDDEARLGILMKELPRLYVFSAEGAEGDCLRISFQPNPSFQEQTYQDRVLHATSGFLFIDKTRIRLCGIDAHLDHRVEFGFGLLGKISEDSKFSMTRKEVLPGEWKTATTQIHIDGSMLLLKSYARDEESTHYDFKRVAANLTVAQAAAMVRAGNF